MIAEKLFEEGLFLKELNNRNGFSETVTYKVIVFGNPPSVGPGTKEELLNYEHR
jgi:hypothetical protein